MRPGRTRPGYSDEGDSVLDPFAGFNEAGAHAPRISGNDGNPAAAFLSFNEAGAHAPRIS